jgi:hypothetical protein
VSQELRDTWEILDVLLAAAEEAREIKRSVDGTQPESVISPRKLFPRLFVLMKTNCGVSAFA